jgi:hypothetical protein
MDTMIFPYDFPCFTGYLLGFFAGCVFMLCVYAVYTSPSNKKWGKK